MPRALLAAIAVAAQAASGSAAQCALILGHDLYGNDLLGPAGKPLPLPVSGPAECCDKCSTKAVGAEPKGRCAAWSYNHGTSTCWMKTGHGNKTGCQPNELCPNGDTSGVVLSATPIDPAADLQQKINAAIASGAATLNVAAGDYFFGNRTLLIQDATNFELRAAGPVTVWFTNTDGGVLLRRCTNVSIVGHAPSQPLRVDRSPPPWSQGTVTKVGPKNTFEFTLDGDSADPRAIQPVPMNQGMIGPVRWKKCDCCFPIVFMKSRDRSCLGNSSRFPRETPKEAVFSRRSVRAGRKTRMRLTTPSDRIRVACPTATPAPTVVL